MLKHNREMLKMCASIITSLIITTQMRDKEKLVIVAQEMTNVISASNDYPESMKRAYAYSVEFLKNLWVSDVNKIVDIALK